MKLCFLHCFLLVSSTDGINPHIPYLIKNLHRSKNESLSAHETASPGSDFSFTEDVISSSRELTFQEKVDLHFSDNVSPLPLGNNEAERHYINIRLQEASEEKTLKAKKEDKEKALKAQQISDTKNIIGNIAAMSSLGLFIYKGMEKFTYGYKPEVNYFLKFLSSVNTWLWATVNTKVFGDKNHGNVTNNSD